MRVDGPNPIFGLLSRRGQRSALAVGACFEGSFEHAVYRSERLLGRTDPCGLGQIALGKIGTFI